LLSVLLFRGLSLDPTSLPAARLGQIFPEFAKLELQSGEVISFVDLYQRPALVNVWATWCYSCRIEHPYLLELGKSGVPIYGLNYKDDPVKARGWLAQLGDPYRLNIVDDEGSLGLDLGVYGAPETYVIDRDGKIVHRHVGILDRSVFRADFSAWFPALMDAQAPVAQRALDGK
tara:strand:+ start:4018 stop:4539 length:522 start_codon:yes stop_codon:yes gene_type:complete